MTVRTRGGRFMLDVRHQLDGRVQRFRLAVPEDKQTRRGAESYERQVLADLRAGIDPRRSSKEDPAPPPATTVPTFAVHWIEYMRDSAKAHNKPSTVDSKRAIFERHLVPAFGSLPLDRIGQREIDRFKASKLHPHEDAKPLKAKTVNNCLTVLHDALAVAVKWGILASAPRIAWLKSPRPPFRFLDFDEAARLVDAANAEPAWHAMIVLALNTGLRQGELLALRWDAVDLRAGRLHVREAVARGVIGTPKGGRSREVPLNNTAVAVLKAHKHLRGPLVFCSEDGRMLTKNECKWPLRRAQRLSGMLALGWHDLRHTFASHLVMRGVPLKAVQELLGHATIEMTMRYAHLAPTVVRDAVRMLDTPSRGHSLGTPIGGETKSGS